MVITMGAQYIGKAVNGLHKNVLLGQITISNTRSKKVSKKYNNMLRVHTTNRIFIHANFHVCFSFDRRKGI